MAVCEGVGLPGHLSCHWTCSCRTTFDEPQSHSPNRLLGEAALQLSNCGGLVQAAERYDDPIRLAIRQLQVELRDGRAIMCSE